MILLINLNAYIGGGETLLIRLAQYLHHSGREYQIMTSGGDCWILEEAAKYGLNCSVWPSFRDSIIYQTTSQRNSTLEAMRGIFGHCKEIHVYTFCMRDLYNALYIFTRLPHLKVWFSHGIYHPEDVYYLSSLSLRPARIILSNRRLLRELHDKKSLLYVNHNGLKISLSPDEPISPEIINSAYFAPLPITITGDIPKRPLSTKRNLRIICISRFVSFKVGAVLAIMRFTGNRPGFELVVIGHGLWKIALTTWMKFKRINNIEIITGVAPDRLDSYIDSCDIGFAQGTSILEIAKRGVPVLIAPYSRIRDLLNSKFPTLGIFSDVKDYSTFGDITDLRGQKTYTISDCIESVRQDYSRYQEQTIEFVKTFSSDIVCNRIVDLIMGSQYSNQRSPYEPPRASLIKRMLKMVLRFRF